MSKTLYIYQGELEKVKGTYPLGVIIDATKADANLQEAQSLLSSEKYHIKSVVITTVFQPNKTKIYTVDNLYYRFVNEEEVREEIYNLTDEEKAHIIGNKLCHTGVDILMYGAIGIKNVIIRSPFINDKDNLKDLHDNCNWKFWAIPNYDEGYYGGFIDPNILRPEATSIYKDIIDNYVLLTSPRVTVNSVLAAYSREEAIGNLSDYIVNFNRIDNPYRDTPNLLTIAFDEKRAHCRAECTHCNNCNRYLESINILINKKKQD